jgi:hypothetical protein
MSTGLFQVLVLVGMYGGLVCLGAGLQGIYRRLGEILDEMTGEAQKVKDEMDFYDRGNREKEKP